MFISSSSTRFFILLFVCVFYKLNKWKDCVLRKQGDGRKNCKLFSRCASAAAALEDESYEKIYTESSMFEFTSEFMSVCVEDSDTQHHYKTLEKWSTARKRERERQSDTPFSIRNIFYAVMTNAHDFSLSRDATAFWGSRGGARWTPAWVRVLERDGAGENIRWKSFCINFSLLGFHCQSAASPKFSHRTRFLSRNTHACTNRAYLSFRWNPHQSLLRPFRLRCWIVEITSFDTEVFQLRVVAIP